MDRLLLSAKRIIPNYELNSYLYQEDLIDGVLLELRDQVYAYKHQTSVLDTRTFTNTVTRPRFANPWEHLKARYAGRPWFRWFVKRYPVRFIEEVYPVTVHVSQDLSEYVTFPDSRIVFNSNLGNPVVRVAIDDQRITWSGPVDKTQPIG